MQDRTGPRARDAAEARLAAPERAVLDRREAALAAGVWREEGLTVGTLAGKLGTAEHGLRRVINMGLGHRNFAAFLNEYRIGAAIAILADPAQADRPVQAIAFDLGYGSPGPFNRAFRAATGTSPSASRAAEAGRPAPEPE